MFMMACQRCVLGAFQFRCNHDPPTFLSNPLFSGLVYFTVHSGPLKCFTNRVHGENVMWFIHHFKNENTRVSKMKKIKSIVLDTTTSPFGSLRRYIKILHVLSPRLWVAHIVPCSCSKSKVPRGTGHTDMPVNPPEQNQNVLKQAKVCVRLGLDLKSLSNVFSYWSQSLDPLATLSKWLRAPVEHIALHSRALGPGSSWIVCPPGTILCGL